MKTRCRSYRAVMVPLKHYLSQSQETVNKANEMQCFMAILSRKKIENMSCFCSFYEPINHSDNQAPLFRNKDQTVIYNQVAKEHFAVQDTTFSLTERETDATVFFNIRTVYTPQLGTATPFPSSGIFDKINFVEIIHHQRTCFLYRMSKDADTYSQTIKEILEHTAPDGMSPSNLSPHSSENLWEKRQERIVIKLKTLRTSFSLPKELKYARKYRILKTLVHYRLFYHTMVKHTTPMDAFGVLDFYRNLKVGVSDVEDYETCQLLAALIYFREDLGIEEPADGVNFYCGKSKPLGNKCPCIDC
ncbi:hypothetical protein STEG23_008393 [Scotinomys teguina]